MLNLVNELQKKARQSKANGISICCDPLCALLVGNMLLCHLFIIKHVAEQVLPGKEALRM